MVQVAQSLPDFASLNPGYRLAVSHLQDTWASQLVMPGPGPGIHVFLCFHSASKP